MNIFAKRKRKSVSADAAPSESTDKELVAAAVGSAAAEERTFQSDAIVEELLQQDPSTWNSKQRRLIKRYQDRGPQQTSPPPTQQAKTDTSTVDPCIEKGGKGESHADDKVVKKVDENVVCPEETSAKLTEESADDVNEDMKKDGPLSEQTVSVPKIDDELKQVLDKLTSKQRRKLVRTLERGDADVETIRAEATLLLSQESEKSTSVQGKEAEPTVTEDSPPKKKRRKAVDLSTLAPEERMRREEQRRLQQEAAKARENAAAGATLGGTMATAGGTMANGNGTPKTYKHPLNSERRRANRRKPKWESNRQGNTEPPNEHDLSGYHMRKITGGKSAKVK